MSLYKDLVKKVSISPEKKVKQKEHIPQGFLPIVDQGKSLVGGYSKIVSRFFRKFNSCRSAEGS